MKVMIANYRYFVSSGPERYLFNITHHLEQRGHEVMPFSINYSQNESTPYSRYFVSPLGGADEVYFDQHKKTPATLVKTLSRLFYSREVEDAAARMVEQTLPDIAYVLYFMRKMSPSLLVGIKRHGVPIVARISDYGTFCPELHCLRNDRPCTLCQQGHLIHSVRHRCVKGSLGMSALEAAARTYHRARGFLDLVDRFVVTNRFMLEMMVEAGFPRGRLVCLPTFTDVERFAPPPPDAARSHLVCVGRLDRPKGIPVLLEALSLLHARGIDAPPLKIAGAGHDVGYVAELENRARSLGLEGSVEFMGKLDAQAIPDLLRGAVCAVLPALWFENLPNTLVESMACGTPVVASDIGSLSACVRDGVDGLLARPGDPADLADKIARVLGDKELAARLSANARRSALVRYSPQGHTQGLLDLFDELLAETTHRTAARTSVPAQ